MRPYFAVGLGLERMGANATDLQDTPEQGSACRGKLFFKGIIALSPEAFSGICSTMGTAVADWSPFEGAMLWVF